MARENDELVLYYLLTLFVLRTGFRVGIAEDDMPERLDGDTSFGRGLVKAANVPVPIGLLVTFRTAWNHDTEEKLEPESERGEE